MAPDLAGHLLDRISWHRTWLAVKDFGKYVQMPVRDGGRQPEVVSCRTLRLEVRVAREGYRKGQCLSVPEPAIDRAIRKMSEQSEFRRRVTQRQLTCDDINRIVSMASDGTIDLELES